MQHAVADAFDPSAALIRALDRWELASFRRREAIGRALGLRADELLVLRLLDRRGQTTQDELAAFAGLSRSGMGAMLVRLERGGLVARHPARSDRRLRPVRLTARARLHLARADAAVRAGVTAFLAAVSEDERALIERFLAVVADAADEQAGVEPERPAAPAPQREWAAWG